MPKLALNIQILVEGPARKRRDWKSNFMKIEASNKLLIILNSDLTILSSVHKAEGERLKVPNC